MLAILQKGLKIVMKTQNLEFKGMRPFSMQVTYHNPHNFSLDQEPPSHVHNQCEIYLNLSGNVYFIVEGSVYPIAPGSVIITKPFEYHHCVYYDTNVHEHFCLMFSANGNEDLFKIFFDRQKGENNHIALPPAAFESVKNNLLLLLSSETSEIKRYLSFFKILCNIADNYAPKQSGASNDIPQNLKKAIHIVDTRFHEPLTVSMLAQETFLSVNTLERYFKKYLITSPSEYIRTKRLAAAVELINRQTPISVVAAQCGFPDTSNFCATFKRYFGTTPHKYMKNSAAQNKRE